MERMMKIGIVGAGAIAQSYKVAIENSQKAELAAVADIHVAAAEALAADTGAKVFASHIDLAGNGDCDAVIVTTPPVTHTEIVIDLAARKLPVLCEKPIGIDYGSVTRMVAAAKENGVLLSMASKFRFCDDVRAARDMILAGEIGKPLMLENVFTGVVDMTKRWNSDPAISGGGVLIDNGTHCVDIIRFLLGPIVRVLAMPAPQIQKTTVEDGVSLFAHTASGAQATAETSWSIHKDRSHFIAVYGETGAIEIGWKGSRIRRTHNGPWEDFGTGYDKVAAFTRQIDDFVGAIKGEVLTILDTEDALASVAVIDAAYVSMSSGRWETVEARPRDVSKLYAAL